MIRVKWDPEKPMDIEVARESFTGFRRVGYVARTVGGEVLQVFDESLGEVVFERPPTWFERIDQIGDEDEKST